MSVTTCRELIERQFAGRADPLQLAAVSSAFLTSILGVADPDDPHAAVSEEDFVHAHAEHKDEMDAVFGANNDDHGKGLEASPQRSQRPISWGTPPDEIRRRSVSWAGDVPSDEDNDGDESHGLDTTYDSAAFKASVRGEHTAARRASRSHSRIDFSDLPPLLCVRQCVLPCTSRF